MKVQKKIINGVLYYCSNGLLIEESECQRIGAILDELQKGMKIVEAMTDKEVLAYIKSRDQNREVPDKRDLEQDNYADELSEKGHYKLIICRSKENNPNKLMVSLCRAGLSRYKAVSYATLIERHGQVYVASSNSLEKMERWQRRLADCGVQSRIDFSD